MSNGYIEFHFCIKPITSAGRLESVELYFVVDHRYVDT